MKQNFWSGIVGTILGAVFMFVLIVVLAFSKTECCKADENANASTNAEYEQIKLTSAINAQDCFICGDKRDPLMAHYWKEDNIGILNLNTFDVMYISINRYDINGEQIKESTGVLESSSKKCGDSILHTMTDPDRGYSHVEIPKVSWKVNQKKVQRELCQNCLDQVNDACIWGKPAEYAVVSFKEKQIRPIVDSNPWFVFGGYSVAVERKDKKMSLKIDYCPPRYA